VMSALLVAAKLTASATATGLGNVIPDGLPFVDDLKKKAGQWAAMAEKLVEAEDTLAEFEVDVHESAETAEGGVDAKSDISDVGSGAGKAKRIAGDSYKVLKSLLVDAKEPPTTEDGDTLEDLIGTTVVRVSHPTKGSIHWVAKTHLLELERKGFKFTDAVDAGPAGPGGDVESPSQCCVIV
jgi:hypothetical protein